MDLVNDLVVRATSATNRSERVEAYAQLVTRFRGMACGYAFALLGDFHMAEDAAQEAFVLAFERLGQLENPAAFGGWLRRVVASACGRIARQWKCATASLDAARSAADPSPGPAQLAEAADDCREVLAAVERLPAPEREVLLLFGLGGLPLREVASFLEVPLTTVKNRLHAARVHLQERMLPMVENTLQNHVPGDRFDRAIVARLLAQPDLTILANHPIRAVYDGVRAALPEYEEVRGSEVVPEEDLVNPWMRQFAVPAGPGKILRPETTAAAFAALAGRRSPVRLVTAGRVFRGEYHDRTERRVYHGLDLICVARGTGEPEMKATIDRIVVALLGPRATRYERTTLPSLAPCYKVEAQLGPNLGWRGIAGCGVIKDEYLREHGFESEIGGFVIAAELENLVALKQTAAEAGT